MLRLGRLLHRPNPGLLLVPLDHSVSDGPIATAQGFGALVTKVVANGADGLVLHKGRLRFLDVATLGTTAVIVHLSASTSFAADPDAKVLVAGIEDALRLGADGVSVHVNLGADSEAQQLADLGRVSRECRAWGMPLLAMVYPRGPRIADGSDHRLIRHAAAVAVDLGADMVKLPYTGCPETMADVVDHCPIPVLAAGGSFAGDAERLDAMVEDVMMAGAAGVAIGRNIFESPDPEGATRRVASIVHGELRSRRFLVDSETQTGPLGHVTAV